MSVDSGLPDFRGKNRPYDPYIPTRNEKVVRVYEEEMQRDQSDYRKRERRPKGKSIADTVVLRLRHEYPELNRVLVEQIWTQRPR